MLLTIDAGNTRTKWAIFNAAGEISHAQACPNDALTEADFSPETLHYQRVVISNVAGEQHAVLLASKLAQYALPVRWIKSTAQACDVHNGYALAETLGSDRWTAMIAAWHSVHAPCVVVNAGTAVTIDALQVDVLQAMPPQPQAKFIGGLILPGLNLMQQSLGLAAAQLPMLPLASDAAPASTTAIFASNTASAMHAGALHAILGAVILMAQALKLQCQQTPCIIVSGGNAAMLYENLMKHYTAPVFLMENLVLQGLYLLENFMQSDTQ